MRVYDTPGVYYERLDAAPDVTAVRTDVAGFVGIATRGPLQTAIPVQSWRQFQTYFGGCTGAGYLAYAVRAFFENGGRRCWVVRVASDAAAAATAMVRDTAGRDMWRLAAFSPGVWGNDLDVLLKETHHGQTSLDPNRSTPEGATVGSVTGFERFTLARISQGSTTELRVVSGVDPVERRLWWVHPTPEARLPMPYDTSLPGFTDPSHGPVVVESVEYTVLVRERGRLSGVFERLSSIPRHPRYAPRILSGVEIRTPGRGRATTPEDLGRNPAPEDAVSSVPAAPLPLAIEELRSDPLTALTLADVRSNAWIALQDGLDGLVGLRAGDFVGEPIDPLESDLVRARKRRGLRVLEDVSEVAIVAVPDIHIQPVEPPEIRPEPPCVPDECLPSPPPAPAPPRPPALGELPPRFSETAVHQVQAAMVEQCERLRDRIAVLDPPFATARDDELGIAAVRAWRRRFDSKYAAFYYPWLRVVDPLRGPTTLTRDVPPSGHVVGQYARTDLRVGVHKAPANAPLAWAQDVTVAIGDAVHGLLNPLGINVIRVLPGRGIRIFGARTVSSDADWRYVNVRRLLMMIEKAIDLSLQWAVFEPNDHRTRAKLDLVLRSFLLSLWQRGALMGGSPDAAFRVVCDDSNNPASERGNGRLLAEVRVAPSKPFEFVVLRVGRTENAFEVTELASEGGS